MKFELFCQGCGKKFEMDYSSYDGRVCSDKCWDTIERIRSEFIVYGLDHLEKENDNS